jgi:hypothetical protein
MRGGIGGMRGVFGTPLLDGDLLGPDGALAPEEAGFEAGDDGEVFFGSLGGLDVEDALVELVELAGGGFDTMDVHAGEDLDEGIDDVVEIGGKNLEVIARGEDLGSLGARLEAVEERDGAAVKLGEIVVEEDEIADDGAVKDFEQEAVLVAAKLIVKGVEELLVDGVAIFEVVVKGGDEAGKGGDVGLRKDGLLDAHDGHRVFLHGAADGLDLLDEGTQEIGEGRLGALVRGGYLEDLLGFIGQRTHL